MLACTFFLAACDAKILSPEDRPADVPPGSPPPATPPTPVTVVVNAFANARFYVKPVSNAKATADQWRSTRPSDAAEMDRIAAQPVASWLGEWSGDVGAEVSRQMALHEAAGALPVFVAYNIPSRDCGGYSAGGLSASGYGAWVRSIAAAIGSRKAVVLLEPDALAGMGCLDAAGQSQRVALLADAVNTLKAQVGISVYIDAGHPNWQSASTMADRLRAAGIDRADGFVLNISNFATNASNTLYGEAISGQVGGKHFVVDTSRNGLGPGATWCNPEGRALGRSATATTGHPLIDAYFWVKAPGESDGTCGGGPSAGSWWASYALGMAQRTTMSMLGNGNLYASR